ncbi:hypothetical protein CKF54_07540 [Psittacicella hinzii]|uniref:Uncharacterized protein n=1 Tax=Psittacicella hinzii TaxID=2028575 RepID=A0A3A1XYS4_9GAMM|nr:hypothetical protein [Psittacicella hinzii]RIY31123.1 hypothetical protein CKF54_07540 [Psittacicella hinzii]
MYLAAFHHFFKDFWQKTTARRRKRNAAHQPRELISPVMYNQLVEDLGDLFVPGLQQLYFAVEVVPAVSEQEWVSHSGKLRGIKVTGAESTVDLYLWAVDDRGVYYEISRDLDYLLVLASKLLKEEDDLASFWDKLTLEQKQSSPIAPEEQYRPILAKVHPEFALALKDMEPNDFAEYITQSYAYVETLAQEVYQHLEELRHNDWIQAYIRVQANNSFEIDFAEESEEEGHLWDQDLEEIQANSEAYLQKFN